MSRNPELRHLTAKSGVWVSVTAERRLFSCSGLELLGIGHGCNMNLRQRHSMSSVTMPGGKTVHCIFSLHWAHRFGYHKNRDSSRDCPSPLPFSTFSSGFRRAIILVPAGVADAHIHLRSFNRSRSFLVMILPYRLLHVFASSDVSWRLSGAHASPRWHINFF